MIDSANIVQVRPLAVSKGRALKHLLAYLQKKYRRSSRQQQLSNRKQHGQHGSDSEEDPSSVVTTSLSDDSLNSHSALAQSLSPAAIQSAMAESGVLVQRDGEQSGYEEDTSSADDDQPADKPTKSKQANRSAAPSTLSTASARPAQGIRSRRPSLADGAEGGEAASETSAQSHSRNTSLVLPSPTSSVMSPSSSAAASSSQSSVPLDFVLCLGSFMERDEDIFPLLNEWADNGSLPPGLSSSTSTQNQHSTHSTPSSMHSRRLSMQQTQLSGTQPLPSTSSSSSPNHNHSGTAVSISAMTSPMSTQSLTEMLSPAGSEFGAGSTGQLSSLNIFTVTVGEKPSKARYSIPDLTAANSLIVQLAHTQHQPTQSPSASPPSRSAALSGSFDLKGVSEISLPAAHFDSEKEIQERQSGRGAGKQGLETSAR